MWEKAERKARCDMCNEPIIKGEVMFVYRFQAYRASKNLRIHAKHFKFKKCDKCQSRLSCLTNNNKACKVYKGVLSDIKE